MFCCNIEHVDKMEIELRRLGAKAVGVHSKSVIGKRDKAVEAFRCGAAEVLISCNMFSTGFDVPDIDSVSYTHLRGYFTDKTLRADDFEVMDGRAPAR